MPNQEHLSGLAPISWRQHTMYKLIKSDESVIIIINTIINSVQNITYILQKLQTHIYIVNVQGSSSI